MQFIFGVVFVLVCILLTFTLTGGSLHVLLEPGEFIIIAGAAMGSFIIANPKFILGHTLHALKIVVSPQLYKKEDYLELLKFIFNTFKIIQSKGILSIEKDLDDPFNSEIFKKYTTLMKNKECIIFFCDYLRVINMGFTNKYQMEDLMLSELETMHEDHEHSAHALQNLADSFPALGIVAAVLGVIKTMASINEPPEVLGHMIGGALVGTFLGVLIAYGFLGPMAQFIEKVNKAKAKYITCIKIAILYYLDSHPAQIIVEAARKEISENNRPSFAEVEKALYEK